jgi:hypothetical protein
MLFLLQKMYILGIEVLYTLNIFLQKNEEMINSVSEFIYAWKQISVKNKEMINSVSELIFI